MELPLFPLHTVLCPGVALPLHVFEERYRRLVARCLDGREPFGVVLIREGREVGAGELRLARIGTTALIREAGRYSDGRFEIMTVGGQRFHIRSVVQGGDRYLVADVALVEEQLGDPAEARRLSARVSERFLQYLELLQPVLADEAAGSDIEVEIVVEEPEAADLDVAGRAPETDVAGGPEAGGDRSAEGPEITILGGSDAERRDLLMAAARRLVTPGDPTAISYVLTGLIQIELGSRQSLLEAPDTEDRLRQLDQLLGREIGLLQRHLKPLMVDAHGDAERRN
jgi:Lon protease-like protein